ncbi:PLP-dependent cysteine synthase family protein [Motiliproteus coralliicola]|uniref:L-cysteine desulfhydrase Cds1 n=1 Tax=Motiliproteus coralliicola TaxID=2283196 RepID=A0A369WCG3_9GAMM|nr:PLP-dependent cysteine synthase family protein [Motiliproteus coralliicola]RDE19720.1 PLP-dependent cysteine synthase family protein [Motiliproteus coralliicola]
MCNSRWIAQAIRKIDADFNRSADTHLIKQELEALDGIDLYLKDESTHPTGSLKHRLARSLFLYALCNGWIDEGTPIIESSSGSTAISEAYFARLLGLPFIAVVPEGTAQEKLAQIEFYGGRCHKVAPADIYSEAQRLAEELNGHYMDQFTYAERATDWRGNNNIADAIFQQMALERFPEPRWVVMSAGTGGTSATIGRYLRYSSHWGGGSRLCVVDPENSVFYDYYQHGGSPTLNASSRIEGIGRPRVEPSFIPTVIDEMMQIPDAASLAAMEFLSRKLGRKIGASTGTNFIGMVRLSQRMKQDGEQGSLVTLICDSGERYLDTYHNPAWLEQQGLSKQVQRWAESLKQLEAEGSWVEPV